MEHLQQQWIRNLFDRNILDIGHEIFRKAPSHDLVEKLLLRYGLVVSDPGLPLLLPLRNRDLKNVSIVQIVVLPQEVVSLLVQVKSCQGRMIWNRLLKQLQSLVNNKSSLKSVVISRNDVTELTVFVFDTIGS